MQKLPTVNRWKWWDNGFNRVSVEWEEEKPWMTLTFTDTEGVKCTMGLRVESVRNLADSLQEIVGPPADRHVAFPEESDSLAEVGEAYGT